MSFFTYLSIAVVVAAAYFSKAVVAAAAGEASTVHHIRRLSSSSSENEWYPFKNEMSFRLAALAAGLVTMLVGVCIVHALVNCCNCRPIQQASCQPAPRRIIPVLMSIEPALIFTNGLTLAGGTDQAECAICLSEFVQGEDIRILSNCRHGFHLRCIEPWLQLRRQSSTSCPICRTSVNQNPPENQQQQLQNDVDLEAAANPPPDIEMMVLQQQQQQQNNVDVEAANLPEPEIVVVLQQQQQQTTESVN